MTTLREAVESFLYREAQLLDNGQLQDWLELFEPTCEYQVAPMDVRDAPPDKALYLVDDDAPRLKSRVEQLLSGKTFSEAPLSRTRRTITNILIAEAGPQMLRIDANFIVNRFRHGNMDTFVGRHEHLLAVNGERLRFRKRKCILDHEALRPQGKLSILL